MFKSIMKKYNRSKLKNEDYAFLFAHNDTDEMVVFDTETTGLKPKIDEILSIGAVILKNDMILTSKTFEVFLKPSKEISQKSITIHNIRPCDLENAQEPQEGIDAFLKFIGSRPLIGYYLEFDVAMINKYTQPWLGIKLPNEQIEISSLYFDKKINIIPQGNIDLRFDTIMRNLNVPNMGQHNAVNDAIMTAMMYLKLKKRTV